MCTDDAPKGAREHHAFESDVNDPGSLGQEAASRCKKQGRGLCKGQLKQKQPGEVSQTEGSEIESA